MRSKRLSERPFAFGCVALVCLLAACRDGGERSAEAASARNVFPVAIPDVRDVTITREYVADVRAARHAEVRSRIAGIVETVSVDEGQAVERGQVLFTIHARARKQDLAIARAATAAAEAELQAARLELENTKLLADKNVVSAAELARARSKVDRLRAKVEEAKAATGRTAVELDRAEIRAPFDGVINRLPYKVGSAIDESSLLTTISDASEALAYFAIAEREYLELLKSSAAGPRTVGLLTADGSTFPHTGTIDAVGSEIDAATGTITYRARFPNPDGILKHGSSAKVVLAKTLRSATVVPQKATFEVQGDVYMYTLDEKNTVHARKIIVKERTDGEYIIERGVGANERFVLEGLQKLEDGVRVEPRTPPRTAPPIPSRG